MTTLTERLRELEERLTLLADLETTLERDAVALAQELHALLVECGARMEELMSPYIGQRNPQGAPYSDICFEAKKLLTKLKQAGIV